MTQPSMQPDGAAGSPLSEADDCGHLDRATGASAPDTVLCAIFEPFKDDGTLDLVRLAAIHPVLKKCFNGLVDARIPEFNSILAGVQALLSAPSPYEVTQVEKYRSLCRALAEDLGRDLLALDCIDLDCLQPEWGSKCSVRQTRREMINICESLSSHLDGLLERLAAVATVATERPPPCVTAASSGSAERPVKQTPATPLRREASDDSCCENVRFDSTHGYRSENASSSAFTRVFSEKVTKDTAAVQEATHRLWDSTTLRKRSQAVGVYAAAPAAPAKRCNADTQRDPPEQQSTAQLGTSTDGKSGRSQNLPDSKRSPETFHDDTQEQENDVTAPAAATAADANSDDDGDHVRRHKRSRNKRAQQIDWSVRVREKIDAFKKHTSQGGCVTTLYEHPVNRDTLLALLGKCEPYLELETPTPFQIKMSIETFIAGLDTALADLQQLRVNKSQMRLLYQSATVLDTLSSPAELLPEIKSLQGLLKTFGMF